MSGGAARARRGPLDHALELLGRLAQVGLHHDPGRGPVAQLGLVEQLEHELHAWPRACPPTPCRCAGGRRAPSPAAAAGACAARRPRGPTSGASGRSSGRERRHLHGQVHARERPERVRLERRARGPARRRLGERVERVEAAGRVAVRLGLVTVASPSRSSETAAPCSHSLPDRAAARRAGVSPTMKRCAMCRTPAAAAAPSAARPAFVPDMRIAAVDRRRALVHLLQVAGRGAAPGRRASGRPGSRPRTGTAPRAAPASCEASSIALVERAQRMTRSRRERSVDRRPTSLQLRLHGEDALLLGVRSAPCRSSSSAPCCATSARPRP